ncbi:hypothetical protein [Candidatus Sororendozoicomonas aggregata]|uniref:hypothetical protein n=1 Tax=Candidatus Sororendozoicomonas aggregata TaxID=3073239 RepID=UPI002ECFCE85
MNTLTKAVVGVSIALLTTMSFAADTGKETSTYKVDAGKKGSGEGSGEGRWGIIILGGVGKTDLEIYDTNTQKTNLTHTKSSVVTHLHHDMTTKLWSGTTSVAHCKDLPGAPMKGCQFVKYAKPIPLYDIKVNLDSENLGTVSFKDRYNVQGTEVITTVSYTLTQ